MSRSGRGLQGRILALGAIALLATAPAASAAGSGMTASRVHVSPLLVVIDLSTARAEAGQTLQAKATVSNLGPALVRRVTVELRFDPLSLKVKGATTEIAQIKAGKSASVSWSVCGRLPGLYVLVARVTLDGASIDSSARILTITTGGKKGCP